MIVIIETKEGRKGRREAKRTGGREGGREKLCIVELNGTEKERNTWNGMK